MKFNGPKIIFTLDTDWCSEAVLAWTLERFVEKKIPITVFATGFYSCLNDFKEEVEIGIHPNFFSEQDHRKVVGTLMDIYPGAQSVRSHGLFEYSGLLNIYREFGLKLDSTPLMYLCEGITPYNHPSGLLRVPIFWEDDDYFSQSPDWEPVNLKLESNGIKCFDFHPIHLKLNSVSYEQYGNFKDSGFQDNIIEDFITVSSRIGIMSYWLKLMSYIEENKLDIIKLMDLWD
jgi:hypothetical protein